MRMPPSSELVVEEEEGRGVGCVTDSRERER